MTTPFILHYMIIIDGLHLRSPRAPTVSMLMPLTTPVASSLHDHTISITTTQPRTSPTGDQQ